MTSPLSVRWVKEPRSRILADEAAVERTVREIIDAVRDRGSSAVREYSQKLDRWDPVGFRVSRDEIERAYTKVPRQDIEDIEFARVQVKAFAEAQLKSLQPLEVRPHPGITLGHRLIPISSVGGYVPGGHYPLIASALMQAATARVAGVERIIMCAPPRNGQGIWPAQVVAMDLCGVDEMYCIGGVQALAAMAFGTSEIVPVDMITGPGNAYVAEAKRQLFGVVGIDLLAGPTEILIIADHSADPEVVACDLLGQAEHGPTSPAHLVTDSAGLAHAVLGSVERQLLGLESREIAGTAWRDCGAIALVRSREEMCQYADWFGPEHLEVMAADLDWYHERLRNYGSLFLGEETTVTYSDKAIGTNHTLPTRRSARYTGGLWVGKFIKVVTYQRCTREGSVTIAPYGSRISAMEGLAAHKATCDLRLQRYAQPK
jgi:sulfopropanediol 3-dehydrogenase